jgi:hypothetical protein
MRPTIVVGIALMLGCDGGKSTGDAAGVDAIATEADAAKPDSRGPDDTGSGGGIDGGLAPARLTVTPAHALLQSIAGGWTGLTVTVKNTGGVPTDSLLMSMTGPDADKFQIMRGNCPAGLAAGERCAVFLGFEHRYAYPPLPFGFQESATLTVVDPGPAGSAVTVDVDVIVLVASDNLAILGPPDMGTAKVGATGSNLPFIVANTGTSESGALQVSLSSPDFVKTDDACSGSSLAVAATCSFAVRFVPSAPGSAWAILTVQSPRLDIVASEIISGTGVGP